MNFKKAKEKWFRKNIFSFDSTYCAKNTYRDNYGICKYTRGFTLNGKLEISKYESIKINEYIKDKISKMKSFEIYFYLRNLQLKSKNKEEYVILYSYKVKELEKELNF